MLRLIGGVLFTYFLSRGLQRLGLRHPPVWKLVASHLMSFAILALAVFALRQPLGIYNGGQLLPYVFGQLVWLLLDLYRAQVAFWKPPVAVTEASPTTREASSR
jgi:hypothetical protein